MIGSGYVGIGTYLNRSTPAMQAGLVFALGPGHNTACLGDTRGNVKGMVLLLAIVYVSAIVLVEAHFVLSRVSRLHRHLQNW